MADIVIPESTSITGETNREDILDILNDETDETDDKVDDEPKPKTTDADTKVSSDEDDEETEEDEIKLAEEEDEDKEPDEEDLDLITPSSRSAILKDFPDLFKKHPYLEKAYYRDQKFTELFATPQEAEEIKERAESVDVYEEQLLAGNTEPILKAIKEQDEEAFKQVVDKYMDTLLSVDQNAHFHVISNIIKKATISMVQESRRVKNDKLEEAALLLNQFIFGTSEFTPPKNLSKPREQSSEQERLARERQSFERERFEVTQTEISSKIENTLKATIDAHIDPKGVMTPYVKKNAVKDAMESLLDTISEDDRFSRTLDRLWEKAHNSNYSEATKKQIRSMYLSKAKTVMKAVIQKSQREALKGLGKRTTVDDGERQVTRSRRTPSNSSSNKGNDGRGMSTLDFFNQD